MYAYISASAHTVTEPADLQRSRSVAFVWSLAAGNRPLTRVQPHRERNKTKRRLLPVFD